jgi:hypothetical protein
MILTIELCRLREAGIEFDICRIADLQQLHEILAAQRGLAARRSKWALYVFLA